MRKTVVLKELWDVLNKRVNKIWDFCFFGPVYMVQSSATINEDSIWFDVSLWNFDLELVFQDLLEGNLPSPVALNIESGIGDSSYLNKSSREIWFALKRHMTRDYNISVLYVSSSLEFLRLGLHAIVTTYCRSRLEDTIQNWIAVSSQFPETSEQCTRQGQSLRCRCLWGGFDRWTLDRKGWQNLLGISQFSSIF